MLCTASVLMLWQLMFDGNIGKSDCFQLKLMVVMLAATVNIWLVQRNF